MAPWLENWEFLRVDAEKLLSHGDVEDVEFSGETYQVKVLDPLSREEVWAFLQISDQGHINDCFCSCQEGTEEHPCVHLAAALLRIYSGHSTPLNVRFKNSLWNQICKLALKSNGDKPFDLEFESPRTWVGKTATLKGRNHPGTAYLSGLLAEREPETEETSLKFSNLSEDELEEWREGKPNDELRYELSFWSDLAKHLMVLQDEGEAYTIKLLFDEEKTPNGLVVTTHDLLFTFGIKGKEWSKIIPSLATVESPLPVHGGLNEMLSSITYNPSTAVLSLNPCKDYPTKLEARKNALDLGEWVYIAGKGFYPKKKEGLFKEPNIKDGEITAFLEEYASEAAPLCEGVKIYTKPVKVNYQLQFDQGWNLILEPYLKKKGDLSGKDFRQYGVWVYVPKDGFYKIQRQPFNELKLSIPEDEIVDFIRDNRSWLNSFEGFETHLGSIETQLKYHVDENGRLTFSRGVPINDTKTRSHDFGAWLYVEGQGFYPRSSAPASMPVPSGVSLAPEQVPALIHQQREDLKLIPGFFISECPVVRAGLDIELTPQERILITPRYELLPEYEGKFFSILEDIIYIDGEGFYELPYDFRVPEKYHSQVELSGEQMLIFLQEELPLLVPRAWHVDPRILPAQTLHLEVEKLITDGKSHQRRYGARMVYHTEKGGIPVYDIWKTLSGRKKCLFSPAGCIQIMDPRFAWLGRMNADQMDSKNNIVYLNTLEWIRLNAFEKVELAPNVDADTRHIWYDLTHMKSPNPPNITGLKSTLRPYQQIGVDWLWFLYNHQLSGLLCDDMGLGKTHQAMALMAAIVNNAKEHNLPSPKFLVLCPTSVLYHWQEKLEAYLPELKVLTLHGEFRKTDVSTADFDVLLTSYGIWRNSYTTLSSTDFALAVFDEIQVAKNHISRTHLALLHVKGGMRLGMTGTPVENHLRELKALFDLVLPTYMPSEADYTRIFVKPIQKEQNARRAQILKQFVKPFVLRRKKEEVLTDLPEKTEEISHCALHSTQRKLYQDVWIDARAKLMEDLSDSNKPIPYIHIFSIISSFKQICDHPALYLKKISDYKKYHSGKWELFLELLNEARESEQKVVVYSQFLGMLDIIEHHLKEHKIGYAGIRGATVDRGEQLQKFHRDPKCEVFVASLQAAGLGVDLTAASVVIHYDRWWNAARENQATDRVHRIGQTRGVQVFKLVTKDTFEERIDQIISRKKELMEDVIGVDDYQIIKRLSRDEILELLQLMGD